MRVEWPVFVVVWLGLLCFWISPAGVHADKGVAAAVVEGRLVSAAGEPMGPGMVAIFRAESSCLPDARDINMVPEAVTHTGPEGEFRFAISPGEYFLGGTGPSSLPGNAMKLDHKDFYFSLNAKGETIRFSFAAGEEKDLGLVPMTADDRDGSNEKCFKIRGVVTDGEGRPMMGMVVLAKAAFNDLRPRFVSLPTNADGAYEIGLTPGSYILIARRQDRSLGRPAPGELLGVFGEEKPVAIGGTFHNAESQNRIVEGWAADRLVNKDITMFVIPDPEKIKLERQDQ